MAREDLTASPDGATLRHLASGLEIVRRRKHEPIDVANLSRAELEKLTDKRFGSKFAADWSLEQLVDWTAHQVDMHRWTVGSPRHIGLPFERTIMTARATPALLPLCPATTCLPNPSSL